MFETIATVVPGRHGYRLDVAKAVLNHSSTEVHAELDQSKAVEIMELTGYLSPAAVSQLYLPTRDKQTSSEQL